ncbi:MAG: O-antigen ligase family protein [Verrucomicrobiales bacterium]|jgi:hypothetical protein|nr:O-antigen ligase family protein [Verrucomicrobiales bacterium]
MNEFFYNGIWRMDWGLGNPNKTAALIVLLMIAVWSLAWVRKWGFWAALVLFTGLGVCLVHTFSRGGLVALMAGLAPLLWLAPRPWQRRKLAAIVVSVCVMLGALLYLNAHERLGQGMMQEDQSISNRLELWKAAPQMMRDAPTGWGLGNSGKAYMQWYQPLDRTEGYRTMVNSHLTWLVELGWCGRFWYLVAWLMVLLLCRPDGKSGALSLAFGVWLAFAVAAFFSSVAESPWLWIVPLLALAAAMGYRLKHHLWPKKAAWLLPFGVSVLILAGLFLAGNGDSAISASGTKVVIGKGNPAVWLLADGKTMGEYYGRHLRKAIDNANGEAPTVAVIQSLSAIDEINKSKLVLAGNLTARDKDALGGLMPKLDSVVIFNPLVYPQEIGANAENAWKVKIVAGEFFESDAGQSWRKLGNVELLNGVGEYLPNWAEIALPK